MSSRRERKKLAKLKHELDLLELDIQQWGLNLYSLILDKEEEVGQPLVSNEECYEENEVDWNLPPRFDEDEVKELQVFDVEPCGVVEGFEQLLIQEECPYSQQELRTILSQEGEYDVYIYQAHFTHSMSTPLEKDSVAPHVHPSQISLTFFEFHGKRHCMEFYLRIKKPNDGDQVQVLPKPKEVQEVLQVVRECQGSLNCWHPGLPSKWPIFLTLVA